MIDFLNYNLDEEIDKITNATLNPQDIHWYSHSKIIRELYKIPKNVDIDIYPYHGIYITDSDLSPYSLQCPEPVLCTRQAQVDNLVNKGRKKDDVFCSGALFPMYKNLKKINKSDDACGTLVYPSHSGLEGDTNVNWQDYINELKKLPDEMKPINICMYWADILQGRHKMFIDNGFKVYTAGHANDNDFVDNFYEILRHHKYVTSNTYSGSNLLYACEFGLPVFIYANETFINYKYTANFKNIGVSIEEYEEYLSESSDFFKVTFSKYPDMTDVNTVKEKVNNILGLDYQTPISVVRKKIINNYKKKKFKQLKNRLKKYLFKKTKDGYHRHIRLFGFIKFSYKLSPRRAALLMKKDWIKTEKNFFEDFLNSPILNEVNENSICIDCGANVGIITEQFANRGATVYSFEPYKPCYDVLVEKFKNNPKVHIFNKGVMDKNTTMKLYKFEYQQYDDLFFSQGASMYKSNMEVDPDSYDEVEVINLIEFIKSLNTRIDILKMDIEGAEFDILELLIKENLYNKINHILVETHEETIPEIRESAERVRKSIADKNIKNIDLTWV